MHFEIGQLVIGKVKSVKPYALFLEFDNKTNGLLHISEISDSFIRDIEKYGSVGEASRELEITKTTILNQCNHKVKTKPRCGYWFRYLSEYEEKGFVL